MAKVATNMSFDADLKQKCQELYADLGMDLTTAVTIFFKQSLRVQGLPFDVKRDMPNKRTMSAMQEYHAAKADPQKYKRYHSFREAMDEVLNDA